MERTTGDRTWWSYWRKVWHVARQNRWFLYCGLATEVGYKVQSCQSPYPGLIPVTLKYIGEYVIDIAYARSRHNTESEKAYKTFLYATMNLLSNASTQQQETRISKLWPQAEWTVIWKNLQAAPVSDPVKITWYRVIHIIPTNTRLHRIHISSTDTCKESGSRDTLGHRLTECGKGISTWSQAFQRWIIIMQDKEG